MEELPEEKFEILIHPSPLCGKEVFLHSDLAEEFNESRERLPFSTNDIFIFFSKIFLFSFSVFHRRCMAVVSPWCFPVLAPFGVFYGHSPSQKKETFLCEEMFSLLKKPYCQSRISMLGSRLVIMALMEWATPVLHWKAQSVAKEIPKQNMKAFFFRIKPCNSGL